jgi:hypothetical protein
VSDTGLSKLAESRNRSVRVRNLPPATQEGLLQQVLEKHALIKRVEVFASQNEALVELENAVVSSVAFAHPAQQLTHPRLGGRKIASTHCPYSVRWQSFGDFGRRSRSAQIASSCPCYNKNWWFVRSTGCCFETKSRLRPSKKATHEIEWKSGSGSSLQCRGWEESRRLPENVGRVML